MRRLKEQLADAHFEHRLQKPARPNGKEEKRRARLNVDQLLAFRPTRQPLTDPMGRLQSLVQSLRSLQGQLKSELGKF